jgi:DUF4097 and DUF4098 domain-containing protein YvlB
MDIGDRAIEIEVSNGDVRISGQEGAQMAVCHEGGKVRIGMDDQKVHLRARPGDLEVRVPAAARLTVLAANGDVHVSHVLGELQIQSMSGDVEAHQVGRKVTVRSFSGDVQVSAAVLDDLGIDSYSGDVRLEAAFSSNAHAKLDSKSGDLRLVVPADQGLEISGQMLSGDFDCELPHVEELESLRRGMPHFVPGHKLVVRVNDGGPKVQINSLSGDVRVLAGDGQQAESPPPAKSREEASPWLKREPFGLEQDDATAAQEAREERRMAILREIEGGELTVAEGLERFKALDELDG